ncbi:MAG: hypothetical protein WB699_08005 [Bacteroidota bacterium]
MLFKIFSVSNFWKIGALVTLAAIPLILLARKKTIEQGAVPEVGDESDIYGHEFSPD